MRVSKLQSGVSRAYDHHQDQEDQEDQEDQARGRQRGGSAEAGRKRVRRNSSTARARARPARLRPSALSRYERSRGCDRKPTSTSAPGMSAPSRTWNIACLTPRSLSRVDEVFTRCPWSAQARRKLRGRLESRRTSLSISATSEDVLPVLSVEMPGARSSEFSSCARRREEASEV